MTYKRRAEIAHELLEIHFAKYYQEWKGQEYNYDRTVFVNMFDQLWEAIGAMRKVENSFVWVAFNRARKAQEKEMCEIVKRFTGSYPRYGFNLEYNPTEI